MLPKARYNGGMTAHTAVKHELLVRYLDAWTPTVLHAARQIRYVDGDALTGVEPGREDGSAGAALRVFTEFDDRLAGHELDMVLGGSDADALADLVARLRGSPGLPAGLSIRTVDGGAGPPCPTFAYFDAAPRLPQDLPALVKHRASEVLLVLDPAADHRQALHRTGLTSIVDLELVDSSGDAQLLLFGTRSAKNLEKFKSELWAVDEYAGIRYRDPRDDQRELLDISASPPVGPLRRTLLTLVRSGPRTMAELRAHTAESTMYRAEETTRAVNGLLASGVLSRDPVKGRLSADTVLALA